MSTVQSQKRVVGELRFLLSLYAAENLALKVQIVFCESIPLGTSGIFRKTTPPEEKFESFFLDSI